MAFTSLRKTVVAASVVAAMALSSGLAQANNYNLGTLGSGATGAGGFGSGASFSDSFSFSLSGLSKLDFGVISDAVTIPAMRTAMSFAPVTFTSFTLTLPTGFSIEVPTFGSAFSFSANKMGAGTYTLGINGSTTGAGGFYGLALNAAPVPEPGEWAMMLAGLGLVSVVARRRSRAV